MSERTYTGQEIVERESAEDRWADAMLRYQVEVSLWYFTAPAG